jgi:drug/metabolite transporter (DMT)-like permease
MAASAVLFALMGFFGRVASAHTHFTLVAATRAAVGAMVAYGVGRARLAPLVVKDRRGIWLRSIFGTGSLLCTFYALSSRALGLGDTTTLVNLTPVFIAILAPFFLKERTGKRIAVALPLCVTGVILILHPAFVFGGGAASTPGAARTAVVAVTASLLSANAMMMLRKISQTEGPEAISLHFSLVAMGVSLLLSLPHLRAPRPLEAGAMLAAGLSAGLGQLCMTRAYALEHAARVSSMGYLAVVIAAGLGVLFLGEVPASGALAGMGLVIAGGLVVTLASVRGQGP